MKNNSTGKVTETKVTAISNEINSEVNKAQMEDVVLYDECGDSLWDKVLSQEETKS